MSDVKLPDFAGGFMEGANHGAEMVNKAVDLERRRFELETKKTEVAAQKFDIFTQATQDIYATPRGPMRDLKIKRLEEKSKMLGIPFDPMNSAVLNDEKYDVDLGKSLAMLNNLTNPQQKAQALNNLMGIMSDGGKFAAELAKTAGLYDNHLQQQQIQAEAKNKPTLNPQEALKLTNETSGNIEKAMGNQIATIRAVNAINTLASNADNRKNPFAQDTAQTLLAKMNDPMTGVRSAEFERLSGLGAGYIEQAEKALKQAATGQGKLEDAQWKQIVTVANAMGQMSQQQVDRVLEQRAPELARAGVDPRSVQSQLGSWNQFDFKSQGWETPAAFVQKKLVDGARQQKQQQNQEALNALKDLTPEQINALVAERRKTAQQKTQVAKGGPNGKKQTAK